MVTMGMVIVAGHLVVDPEEREAYLEGCREVVELARRTEGCLDYALSADVLDPGRINVFERWESLEALEEFRGNGVQGEQAAAIRAAQVSEYGAVEERGCSADRGQRGRQPRVVDGARPAAPPPPRPRAAQRRPVQHRAHRQLPHPGPRGALAHLLDPALGQRVPVATPISHSASRM